jgi:hypothetical protein
MRRHLMTAPFLLRSASSKIASSKRDPNEPARRSGDQKKPRAQMTGANQCRSKRRFPPPWSIEERSFYSSTLRHAQPVSQITAASSKGTIWIIGSPLVPLNE